MGKHYSLGLDLEWMGTQEISVLLDFSNGSQKLLARLITFPMVTVAALNGILCVHGFSHIEGIASSKVLYIRSYELPSITIIITVW